MCPDSQTATSRPTQCNWFTRSPVKRLESVGKSSEVKVATVTQQRGRGRDEERRRLGSVATTIPRRGPGQK
ncbi:hypothetical protein DPEC_G00119360 [Dallia pectoralis]|uniref:Uncharacterized protein n=1 Tax=Dallia pectoralis TaxID=75939 RepID=A0ACC2GQ42_DALPE|nr:hypothetical protein DPEC_G00119360 [Dallia pectoralis]